MNRLTYDVTVSHPTGYHKGTHRIEVTVNHNGTMYCVGAGFGCSRDYDTDNALVAIGMFLREHGCTVTKAEPVGEHVSPPGLAEGEDPTDHGSMGGYKVW